MSKRDKNAIIALIMLVLVVVPIVFVTMPAAKENPVLRTEQALHMAKKDEFLTNERIYNQQIEQYAELCAEIEKLKAALPDLSKSYDAHYAFIGMAEENQVLITNLKIGEIKRFKTAEEIKAEVESPPPAEPTEEMPITANVMTYQLELTIDVSGAIDNIFNLTDSINAYNKNISITKLVLGEVTDEGQKANIVVGIFMALTPQEAGIVT